MSLIVSIRVWDELVDCEEFDAVLMLEVEFLRSVAHRCLSNPLTLQSLKLVRLHRLLAPLRQGCGLHTHLLEILVRFTHFVVGYVLFIAE